MGCAWHIKILDHVSTADHGPTDGPDKGIIPLTCLELFDRVDQKKAADSNIDFTVEVSYIEASCVTKSPLAAMFTMALDLQRESEGSTQP